MGALDHWLTAPDPWESDPAKPAKSAKLTNSTYENKDLDLADPLLSPAKPDTALASLSKPLAKLEPAENRGKQGALADLAGLATPLGQTAAKSKLPPETLDAEDWRSFFNERAAILERDGAATHENANRLAYEACIAALSWVLPANYPHDRCAACGSHLGPQQGLPLADTAVVCDNTCQTRHMRQQRERAETALGEMGVCLNRC